MFYFWEFYSLRKSFPGDCLYYDNYRKKLTPALKFIEVLYLPGRKKCIETICQNISPKFH